jgi:hypothetical protein
MEPREPQHPGSLPWISEVAAGTLVEGGPEFSIEGIRTVVIIQVLEGLTGLAEDSRTGGTHSSFERPLRDHMRIFRFNFHGRQFLSV